MASPSEDDHQEGSGLEKVRGGLTKSRTQSGEDAGIGSEQGQSRLSSPSLPSRYLACRTQYSGMLELQKSSIEDAVLK